MHMQPMYRAHAFVTREGDGRRETNAVDVGADIFERGLCLPSDINMTAEEQSRVIEIVKSCFQ